MNPFVAHRKANTVTAALRKSARVKTRTRKLTPYEAALKVGLVGALRGGPPDLAERDEHYLREAFRAKRAR